MVHVRRNQIDTPFRIAALKLEFNLKNVEIRPRQENEDVFRGSREEMSFPTIFVKECGVTFPLPPLFINFLRRLNVVPTQLTPNAVRIIIGVSVLNRRLAINLGVNEILFCYKVSKTAKGEYYLQLRRHRFYLVTHLPDCNKNRDKDFIFVSGCWESAVGPVHQGSKIPTVQGQPDNNLNRERPARAIDIKAVLQVWSYWGPPDFQGQRITGRAFHNLLEQPCHYRSLTSIPDRVEAFELRANLNEYSPWNRIPGKWTGAIFPERTENSWPDFNAEEDSYAELNLEEDPDVAGSSEADPTTTPTEGELEIDPSISQRSVSTEDDVQILKVVRISNRQKNQQATIKQKEQSPVRKERIFFPLDLGEEEENSTRASMAPRRLKNLVELSESVKAGKFKGSGSRDKGKRVRPSAPDTDHSVRPRKEAVEGVRGSGSDTENLVCRRHPPPVVSPLSASNPSLIPPVER